MKGSSILIGIVIFAVVTSGFWFFVTDLASDYDINVDNEYMDQFNNMAELEQEISQPMRNKTAGSSGIEEGTNAVKLSSGVYAGLKYMYNLPSLVVGLLNNVAAVLGVPGWFVGAAFTILTIVITFLIISAVFGRDL